MNDPTSNCGNIWIRAYTPDGFQVSLTLPADDTAAAMRHLEDVRAAGLLPMMPDTNTGEKHETITQVVRRESENRNGEVIDVLDMYGEGLKWRFTSVYMDTPADVKAFEDASGLTVAKLPVSQSQSALELDGSARIMKYVTRCRPFIAVTAPKGEKEIGGEKKTVYRLSRYMAAPQTAQDAPQAPAATVTPEPAANGHSGPQTGGNWANAASVTKLMTALVAAWDGVTWPEMCALVGIDAVGAPERWNVYESMRAAGEAIEAALNKTTEAEAVTE